MREGVAGKIMAGRCLDFGEVLYVAERGNMGVKAKGMVEKKPLAPKGERGYTKY